MTYQLVDLFTDIQQSDWGISNYLSAQTGNNSPINHSKPNPAHLNFFGNGIYNN